MIFLQDLNLDEVRGRIFGRRPLPTIGEAFAEERREENRQRNAWQLKQVLNYDY